MRILRPGLRWEIVSPRAAEPLCLQRLAHRNGYRVGGISAALGCSERYMRQVFIRDVGLPPLEWLRWERMVMARRLIVSESPQAVAEMLGFNSERSFAREFQAVYRVTPTVYRRNRWRTWCVLTEAEDIEC